MIEYIVAHKETFFVLCVMAFLAILMFILSSITHKDAAKRRAAANTPQPTEDVEEKS